MNVTDISDTFVSSLPINGMLSIPLDQVASQFSLSIDSPNNHYKLKAPLVGKPVVLRDKFIAEFSVDEDVNFILTLMGKRSEDGSKFQSGQFSLFYKITEQRPRAHFIASTLMAVCGLAGKIEIPELVNEEIKFDLPLLEISKLLQLRQIAYRLMVIEQATKKEFLLPSALSRKDGNTIAFVYHAIVDRSFVWHDGRIDVHIPATQERLEQFDHLELPLDLPVEENSNNETVLDKLIALGPARIVIRDAAVENADKVRQELAKADNHLVDATFHSLSGQVVYEFPEAPHLSYTPWDEPTQALIDLEPQLDAAVVLRYHALAASTLEGLTEEEKAAITARPELDEKAFLD